MGKHQASLTSCAAVMSIRTTQPASVLRAAVLQHAGGAARVRLREAGAQAATPAADEAQAVQLAQDVHRELSGFGARTWIAVSWCPAPEVRHALATADEIADLALALRLVPGTYQLDDLAMEYAASRTPAVASRLVALIQPVVARPRLQETLEALIAADGNRARAAERLFIHRSTIDYRLRSIEELTGLAPYGLRGLQTLSTALALHALSSRCGRPADTTFTATAR